MKIYADFNGIEEWNQDRDHRILNLTGYGTLASLSHLRLKLEEGQVFEFVEPGDLSATGITFFNPSRVAQNCSGWFARFRRDDTRKGGSLDHDHNDHICFECRKSLMSHLDRVGRAYSESCPFCGCSIMTAMAAPQK